MLQKSERWVGPFKIRDLLNDCIDNRLAVIPEWHSAYLVTARKWEQGPTPTCRPLYVGGNTGKSRRFRTRVGDLLADAFGFFGGGTGHSSGGQALNRWCRQEGVDPQHLFIAWVEGTRCHRCLEVRLHHALNPKLNKPRPSRCASHPS
jgi:hypothetical protein